jgi:hypothetical protein
MKRRTFLRAAASTAAAAYASRVGAALAKDIGGPVFRAPTARVSVQTSGPTALSSGFAGYNVALMYSGVEYPDPNLSALAAGMSIGWLRYPGGTGSDTFDWTTGKMQEAWVDRFQHTNQYAKLNDALQILSGKGGDKFDDAAALSNKIGSVGLIVCVNGFTDTAASAGKFAAYARTHGINVLAWELSNEPYDFKGFFANAKTYAKQMEPFAQAIRAADPSAKIALFASDAGHQNERWDDALAAYSPRYWDLITYHQYPATLSNVTDPTTLMNLLNDVLVYRTNSYVTSEIAPRFGAMPVIITEFDPQNGSGAYGLSSTLYGGVWAAEYALRLSSSGQVQRVGMHQLINPSGIDLANNHLSEIDKAYSKHTTVDTTGMNFGYFQSAQAVAYGVASSAINSASHVYSTSVVGGDAASMASGGTLSALYAQAYARRGSKALPPRGGGVPPQLYARPYEKGDWIDLVITNKGAAQEVISLAVNGQAVSSQFLVTTATGAAYTDVNTPGRAEVVATATISNSLIQIPAYSVVRVSWN